MSDPETSVQFVTRDEFFRHEARLDSRLDEILQLIGRQKIGIQDGATGLDKEGEIASLKAEIGKLKQEKERQRNLLVSLSLDYEKAKQDMDALRKEKTTELKSVKKQQKTLQQEKEELIRKTASLETLLQQNKLDGEIAVIRAQLEETQQGMNNLEEKLKTAALEESKVREKHEEKIAALDNQWKSLLTNQAHQNLMEERTYIHNTSCSVYDEEILKRIRKLFIQHINPLNVLHVFHDESRQVLTQHDIEKVTAVTERNGKFVGAAELLSCLIRYKDWFPSLLQVLSDPNVRQEHVAKRMKEILEQDPVVDANTNNVMDEDNEEEHHGTESHKISKLHSHMDSLQKELTSRLEDTERSVRGCVAQRERDENRRREIEDRVAVLETQRLKDLEHYTKELEETNSLIDNVIKKGKDISTQLNKLERSVVPARVGFTAYRPKTPLPSTGSHITDFTNVLCNEGYHYNMYTGEFICPIDGLYLVSATLFQWDDGDVFAKIMRQSVNSARPPTHVCLVYTYQARTSNCGVGVVSLKTGDRVYVEVVFSHGHPRVNDTSSFSCVLIA